MRASSTWSVNETEFNENGWLKDPIDQIAQVICETLEGGGMSNPVIRKLTLEFNEDGTTKSAYVEYDVDQD